jgi:rhizosphere induced protein
MAGQKYSIKFKNQSTNWGNACIYQTAPDLAPNMMSLAWIAISTHPTTDVVFEWTIDYGFSWSETGTLTPGVVFKASQSWPADLENTNIVKLKYEREAYTFAEQGRGPTEGTLYVQQAYNIPLKMASIGISMAGLPVFAEQAQPNYTIMITPKPKYWITFGNYTQGEVLDITEVTNTCEIDLGGTIFNRTVTLNQDNTWTVE